MQSALRNRWEGDEPPAITNTWTKKIYRPAMFNLEANVVSVRLKPVIPSVTIGHIVLSGGHRERRLQPLIVTTWRCVSESKSNRSQVLTLPASQVSWDKATMGPSGIPEILGFLELRTAVCERFRGLQPGILVEPTWDFGVQKPGTTCRLFL